jgi:hypothetical protein
MKHEYCPHCGADLTYTDEHGSVFSRGISVEIRGIYDGGLFYQCPDCSGTWHRWPEGDPLRIKAQRVMDEWARQRRSD